MVALAIPRFQLCPNRECEVGEGLLYAFIFSRQSLSCESKRVMRSTLNSIEFFRDREKCALQASEIAE